MKRVLAIASLAMVLLVTGRASAQFTFSAGYSGKQLHWTGEKTNIRNVTTTKDTIIDFGSDLLNSFCVGLGYNIKIEGGLGFHPAIYFNYNKKYETEDSIRRYDVIHKDITYTMMDLTIPLMLSYTYYIPDWHLGVFAYAGPTLQYALLGTEERVVTDTYEEPFADRSTEETFLYDLYMPNENGENFLKRFDLGATVGLGVSFYGATVQAGYNWGFLNRCGYADTYASRNKFYFSQFFVSVGYNISFETEVYSSQDKEKSKSKPSPNAKSKNKKKRRR